MNILEWDSVKYPALDINNGSLSLYSYLKIWGVVFVITAGVIILANTTILYTYYAFLWALILCAYLWWQKHPLFTIADETFGQCFYTTLDDPKEGQPKTIHQFLYLLYVFMGLQKETGIIDKRFKYDNKSVIGMIWPMTLMCVLYVDITMMGFTGITKQAVNVQDYNMTFVNLYETVSIFGLFFTIGFVVMWCCFQLSVMDAYFNWKNGTGKVPPIITF